MKFNLRALKRLNALVKKRLPLKCCFGIMTLLAGRLFVIKKLEALLYKVILELVGINST